MNTPSTSVSPGLGGFLAFFLLAIALWLLMRNMNARLRRMSYREEAEARAAQAGAKAPTGSSGTAGQDSPAPFDEAADDAKGDEDTRGDEDGPRPPAQG